MVAGPCGRQRGCRLRAGRRISAGGGRRCPTIELGLGVRGLAPTAHRGGQAGGWPDGGWRRGKVTGAPPRPWVAGRRRAGPEEEEDARREADARKESSVAGRSRRHGEEAVGRHEEGSRIPPYRTTSLTIGEP
jgi:hypothetical protein